MLKLQLLLALLLQWPDVNHRNIGDQTILDRYAHLQFVLYHPVQCILPHVRNWYRLLTVDSPCESGLLALQIVYGVPRISAHALAKVPISLILASYSYTLH